MVRRWYSFSYCSFTFSTQHVFVFVTLLCFITYKCPLAGFGIMGLLVFLPAKIIRTFHLSGQIHLDRNSTFFHFAQLDRATLLMLTPTSLSVLLKVKVFFDLKSRFRPLIKVREEMNGKVKHRLREKRNVPRLSSE